MFKYLLTIFLCGLCNLGWTNTQVPAVNVSVSTSSFNKNLAGVTPNQQAVDVKVDQLALTPASPNHAVQFNSSSALAGSSLLTFDGTALQVSGVNIQSNNIVMGGGLVDLGNAGSRSGGTLDVDGGQIEDTSGRGIFLVNNVIMYGSINLTVQSLHSTTGTNYVCVNTVGLLIKSTTPCSGT